MPTVLYPITMFHAGCLGLVALFLAWRCSQLRLKGVASIGDGGNAEMARRMRAHANFIEYVPLCLLLIGMLEATPAPRGLVCLLGAGLLLGRVLHAWGMHIEKVPNPQRVTGTSLTWIVLLVGSVCGIYYGLTSWS